MQQGTDSGVSPTLNNACSVQQRATAGEADGDAVLKGPPLAVGLTGSIGMGKSTVGSMLGARGIPVLSADEVVHELYAPGGAAVAPLLALFPEAAGGDGGVDRSALRRRVLGNDADMARLEALVHPLVERARLAFLRKVRHTAVVQALVATSLAAPPPLPATLPLAPTKHLEHASLPPGTVKKCTPVAHCCAQHADIGAPVVFFDIPLLYETGALRPLVQDSTGHLLRHRCTAAALPVLSQQCAFIPSPWQVQNPHWMLWL